MGRQRGSAATRRGRRRGYAALSGRLIAVAGLASAALAAPAAAQSTGGGAPQQAAPELSSPPGVPARKAPELRSWRCVKSCQDRVTASTGSLVRVRGRALGRTYEVVFLGAQGAADD